MAASNGQDAGTELPAATILVSIWACSTAFWSIFTEPHRTYPARVLLFQPLWLLRIITSDLTWTQDLGLFLSLHSIYSLRTGSWKIYTKQDLAWLDVNNDSIRVYLQVFALLGGCGLLAGTIVYRGQQLKIKEPTGPFREDPIEESLLPPLLITSRTAHSRQFPEKHAFSYSYLFAGIPVGLQGRVGTLLSVDSPRPAWFDVRSKDYLSRGNDHFSLGEKLKRYLHTQGVTDRDYAFAYLVTAPRFLGYSFNPVSFWYLYDSDTRLKYMIAEVNNTFDERRMYLLKSDKSRYEDDLGADTEGDTSKKALYFTDTMSKDFHVSPFNSREGSYSLRAVDPLAAFQETGQLKIDNTIVLRSSEDRPKIIARVWSEGEPRDPERVTTFQLTKFIFEWWWVGLATFPRICWEAQKLFFRRKLHVWYRPEVETSSIGRTYTDDEITLEQFFSAFLTDAVEHAQKPLRVIYEPAHHEGEEIVLYSPQFTYQETHDATLTIKVVSPAFYSRFAHYAHAKEAFDRECLTTDDKNRTVVIHGAHALPALLHSFKAVAEWPRKRGTTQSTLEKFRWNILKRMRCPPATASYPVDASRLDSEYAIQDIRSFRFSEMDQYVQKQLPHASEYRRIALKLFVAERMWLGLPVMVVVNDWVVRAALIWGAMWFADSGDAFDVLRPRSFVRADLTKTGFMLLVANGVHLWSLAKG